MYVFVLGLSGGTLVQVSVSCYLCLGLANLFGARK